MSLRDLMCVQLAEFVRTYCVFHGYRVYYENIFGRENMGMSFGQYSKELVSSLTADMELSGSDRTAFDLLLGVVALNLVGKGSYSPAEIMIASGGKVSSARDLNEALTGRAENRTKYDVGSFRLYARNHDRSGNIKRGDNLPSELEDKCYQVRFLQTWMCDENGEPEERVERLRSVMNAARNMQSQVRGNFSAIDSRPAAIARLKQTEWDLNKMPIDVVSLALEEAVPKRTISFRGSGAQNMSEIEIVTTLGGDQDFYYRNSQGRVVWESSISAMQSQTLLEMLPEKIAQSHKNFT